MAAIDAPEDATLEDLDDEGRDAVWALLRSMADDEFVLAERYTEWQVRAPTLESDLAVSNVAQDELGHARLWYDLLEDVGASEADLIWEADPGDFRHSTFVELPFQEGAWSDAILRGYLFDVYEDLHLRALEDSASPRIRDRVGKVRAEEEYHLEHAQNWLERPCDDSDGRERVHEQVERLFPYALTLFEPADHEETIVDLGLRTASLDDLRDRWLEIVVPFLESLGLRVPVDDEGDVLVDPPAETGRHGDHTDHWSELFAEFTQTYEDMEYESPPELMHDPDEA
jgi:ring-1,2-phenylacetyl-CoA epoxidase subunit PaaC